MLTLDDCWSCLAPNLLPDAYQKARRFTVTFYRVKCLLLNIFFIKFASSWLIEGFHEIVSIMCELY